MKRIRGLKRKPFKSKNVRGSGIRLRFKDGRFAPTGARKPAFKGRAKQAVNNKGIINEVKTKLKRATQSKTRALAFESILTAKRPTKTKAVNKAARLAQKLKNKNIKSTYTTTFNTDGVYAHVDTKHFKGGFKYSRRLGTAAVGSTLTAVVAKSILDRVEKTSDKKRKRK